MNYITPMATAPETVVTVGRNSMGNAGRDPIPTLKAPYMPPPRWLY